MEIVTYRATDDERVDAKRRWIAFIVVNDNYLPVRFQGETKEAVEKKALAEWQKHEAERERNIKAREEGRKKAAETRARKAAK